MESYTGRTGDGRDEREMPRAKAQRRKALSVSQGFLCAFAPLREKYFFGIRPCGRLVYSYLSATNGSTLVVRRAGI